MTAGANLPAEKQAVLDNVRKTLATAQKVLEHFEQSLLRSGFAEGSAAYRKMAETLLGQRLWTAACGASLEVEFAAVAKRAKAIHALLVPYADTMLRLSAVAGLQPAPHQPELDKHTATTPDGSTDEVLDLLAKARRPMSMSALAAQARCDRRTLLDRIAVLEQQGRLKRGGSARRPLYSLPEGASDTLRSPGRRKHAANRNPGVGE